MMSDRPSHASRSPGPVNCNIRLRLQRQFFPTVCERCRGTTVKFENVLCPFFFSDGKPKPRRKPRKATTDEEAS